MVNTNCLLLETRLGYNNVLWSYFQIYTWVLTLEIKGLITECRLKVYLMQGDNGLYYMFGSIKIDKPGNKK